MSNRLTAVFLSRIDLTETCTTSSSATVDVTFTDSHITADSMVDYYCSKWDLVPDNIVCSAGQCVVTLPQVDIAETVTVTLRIFL